MAEVQSLPGLLSDRTSLPACFTLRHRCLWRLRGLSTNRRSLVHGGTGHVSAMPTAKMRPKSQVKQVGSKQ